MLKNASNQCSKNRGKKITTAKKSMAVKKSALLTTTARRSITSTAKKSILTAVRKSIISTAKKNILAAKKFIIAGRKKSITKNGNLIAKVPGGACSFRLSYIFAIAASRKSTMISCFSTLYFLPNIATIVT
jgi:hypothetical protein